MPGPRSATLKQTSFPSVSALIVIGVSCGRILRSVFQQLHQHLGNPLQVNAHRRQVSGDLNLDFAAGERLFRFFQPGLDHLADGVGLAAQFHLLGIELCHLGGFADQPVQAVGFFVDDREQVFSAVGFDLRRREQRGDRRP